MITKVHTTLIMDRKFGKPKRKSVTFRADDLVGKSDKVSAHWVEML